MKKAYDSDSSSAETNYISLFHSAPDLYVVLSPELIIIDASNSYLKATLTQRDEIIGKKIFDIFRDNPADANATGVANLRASLERVLQTKAPDPMAVQKYDIQRPENEGGGFEVRYWSPLNSPVFDENNRLLYIIHRVEDVTEFIQLRQKESEQVKITEELKSKAQQMEGEIFQRAQELQRTNQQLREAERIKNDFFANVSHEFRTPLSLIIAPLETLITQNGETLSPSQLSLLKMVHNNSVRLLQMVNGLLDFAKMEAGKMKVHLEPTDLAALSNSVLNDFESMLHGKNIELVAHVNLPHSYIMMDRYLLERILFNLLSNAAKFTADGGMVRVKMDVKDERLRLKVEDTGVGIPESEIQNLFKMFHQVSGPSIRRFEGTGLGLAMVKEFAELLGGSVSVKSTVDVGTSFIVECQAPAANMVPDSAYAMQRAPLVPQYQVIPEEESAMGMLERQKDLKVLVCEDNDELANYVVSLLRDHCRIKVARDGEEGLKYFRSWQPDLVLTDVMLPKISGIEICQTIKSNPETSGVIVVLLTALTQRETLMKGWEAKADEYLFKPFHPTELVTRIRSLFSIIHERKKAVKIAEQRNLELIQSNSELEAFSYSVSHDLKAPLRIISGFSNIVLEDYYDKLDEAGKGYLKAISDNVGRMDRLIDELLEFSRVGRREVQLRPVNMNDLVEEVINQLKQADQNFSSVIRIRDLKPAYCDLSLVGQVWFNLIGNAIKYSRNKELPVIEIGSKEIGGMTAYYVKDNGVGFDMQYAGKLFSIFYRMHTTQEFEGTGIGLALVQRIVGKHGGKVWAEAKVNEGATFYFTLPEE